MSDYEYIYALRNPNGEDIDFMVSDSEDTEEILQLFKEQHQNDLENFSVYITDRIGLPVNKEFERFEEDEYCYPTERFE